MDHAADSASPHPESILTAPDGRVVQLKVHRCLWSGDYPENSLAAVEECYRARAARAEIDLHMLRDADFLVTHDPELDGTTTGTGPIRETTRRDARRLRFRWRGGVSDHRPPLFSEVVDAIRLQPFPTLLELDAQDLEPWPWERVEELARLVAPVKDRVIFNGPDWNLRRLLRVDPSLPVSFDPAFYLDWVPEGDEADSWGLPRGAYGYLDAHPLARERLTPVADYLADRLGGIMRLVPGAREAHVRLAAFERMLDDGVADVADLFHGHGLLLDLWTLDADTPSWRSRLARAVASGADIVTTKTPRRLATAGLTAS